MKNLDFDWQTNEFMLYCRSTQFCTNVKFSTTVKTMVLKIFIIRPQDKA